MPVHFADGAGLDVEMRCGDGLGDGEVGGVGDADLTTCRVNGFLVEHLVGELELGLLVTLAVAGDLLLDGTWIRALEDVLLLLGDGVEDFGGDAEVLA